MTIPVTRGAHASRAAARMQTRRKARRSSWKKRIKTAVVLLFLMAESAVAVALVIAVMVFWRFSNNLPSVEDLRQDARPPVATTIWSEDKVLLGKLVVENRQPIPLDEMPRNFINATVAIEDRRFFEHPGVDAQGIGRAVFANLAGNSATRQGGSTLTQQLVRNIGNFGLTKDKKYSRKIREALTALRLEQLYSKNEILSLYLNNIYYGGGAYGAQAASRTYFGKSAYKLSLAESAMLAGLPQRPSAFTPFEHPKAALKRRDEVLDNMFKYHYITQAQLDAAKAEKPRLMPQRKKKDYDFKAPYFTWHVLNDLTRRYGVDYVYSGLRIETTLNWKMQQMGEQELEWGLRNHSDGGEGPNQGALVSLDNNTGYIRVMVGGRNFRASQYNNVTMGRRQPGSTFKVFDYAAAFDTNTCDLNDSFPDKPIPYPNNPKKIVKNFSADGGYSYQDISCRTAIQFSKNTVAVQVAAKVGIEKVIEYAHRMGIKSTLQAVLPTALGASEVHPLDLASAYSVFPLKGSRYTPLAIVRVFDRDGNIVEEHIPEIRTDILKAHTVEQMEEALELVVRAGTGTQARSDGEGHVVENAHGKTGTTSDSRDAWFAGYTPELTSVIWVAQVHHYNQKHPLWPTYMPMGGVTGGHVCAPIWRDFMLKAVPEQRKFHLPGVPMLAVAPAAPAENASLEEDRPLRHPRKRKDETKAPPTDPNAKPQDKTQDAKPADGQTDATGDNKDNKDNKDAKPDAVPGEDGSPRPSPDKSAPPEPVTPAPAAKPPRTETAPPKGVTLAPPRAAPPAHSDIARNAAPRVQPAPRPVVPRAEPPRPAEPKMVEVSVCVESGGRATPWCPSTHTRSMTAKQAARLGRCHTHKPPPGEG